MKKLRITALILALLMIAGALASCNKDDDTDADTSDSEAVTNDDKKDNGDSGENKDAVDITVTDAKGSTGLTGDFKAAFAAESGAENVITGAAQNAVPYAIYASLPSPTKITSLVLTAPSQDQDDMANATIDASVDGEKWVELKTLGSNITKGKTYTLAVSDDTQYLYVRVRQADEHRTEEFRFRTLVIKGIAGQGSAGDISKIAEEKDTSALAAMKTTLGSNAGTGTQADAFLDSANAWTSKASSEQNYLIGTMEKTTEIRGIKVKVAEGNTSVVGAVVQASTDGQTWVDLYTVTDAAEQTWYINDSTAYSYVRVLQAEGATGAFTIDSVLIYGIASADDTEQIPAKYVASDTVKVTYDEAHTNVDVHSGTAASVWDLSDKSTQFTNKQQDNVTAYNKFTVAGKFEYDTVITQIKYYCPSKFPERVRTSYFEVSADGENWEKLDTMPGDSKKDGVWQNYVAGAVFTRNIDSDVKWKYIRIVHPEGMFSATDKKQYYWTLGTIEVIGVQYDADGNIIQPDGNVDTPDTPDIPTGATTQAVTYVATAKDKFSGSDYSSVWDASNTNTVVNWESGSENWISGKLQSATRITQIKYYSKTNASRADSSLVQASVDGETWVTIATLPSLANNTSYSLDVTDTTQYSYVKLVQTTSSWWSVGTVEVIGIASTANA